MNKPKPKPKAKPKPTPTLKGKAAIKELQKQTSKKGVAAMEKKAAAALDKKYGWMK
tara:strand:+ start:1206 stop:1373 length:168 start_codon:yes stop_codon:yes gene_type:complete